MNNTNTLSSVLLDTLTKAKDEAGKFYDLSKGGLSSAADFAQREIPATIKQLMNWEFWYHFTWASINLISILVLIIAALFIRKTVIRNEIKAREIYEARDRREYNKFNSTDYTIGKYVSISVAVVGSCLILFLGLIPDAMTCAKIKTAPNIFFIEYCNDLWNYSKNPGRREHNH